MSDLLNIDITRIDPLVLASIAGIFAVGLLIGFFTNYILSRRTYFRQLAEIEKLQATLKAQADIERERLAAISHAEERMAASFSALAYKSLEQNSDSFLRLAKEHLGKHQERAQSDLGKREQAIEALVKPIQKTLEETRLQIGEIEKHRHETFGNIRAQLETMAAGQVALQSETRNLVTALRRPEVRGQWGELTLRRIAELAGMVEHCDFIEQAHVSDGERAIRPDMVVRLPDRGEIIVDVKTPLDAYLQAVEADNDADRKAALARHARNVAERIRELAGKSYWAQFESSPEFVILFIPGDQFLTAALSENPNLLEDALREKVILATPTSLVALLKAIAYGWRQLALAENAEQIKRLAQDLHGRLGTFSGHLARLGKQLQSGVNAYNKAVGSLERLVLPGARKFVELGVHEKKAIEEPAPIETIPRDILSATDEDAADETAAKSPELTSIDVSDAKDEDTPPAH